jgi:hypothetical protein
MMKKLRLLLTGLLSALVLFSCQTPKSGSKSSAEEQLSEFGKEVNKVYPDLGSPGEIAMLIEMTGADYVPDLVADTANTEKYLGDEDMAALNLGLFTADLAYTTSFQQRDQSLATLKSCQTLANDLGVGVTYLASLMKYYDKEVEHKDSILMFLEQKTGTIKEDLSEKSKQRLYTAFVTGFVVENLHLATGIIQTYPDDLLPDDAKALVLREMILIVLESERNVNELITMVDEVLTDQDPRILYDELVDLKASFDKVNFEEIAHIENPAEILSNEGLLEITDKVAKLRATIVGV